MGRVTQSPQENSKIPKSNSEAGANQQTQSPVATGGESARISAIDYQGHTNGHLEDFVMGLPSSRPSPPGEGEGGGSSW
jgi:hypothetical protein